MTVISRVQPIHKTEYKPGEFKGLKATALPETGEVFLVSCPGNSYNVISARDCQECPFWYGFVPQPEKREQPISPSNIMVLCGFPIGRRVDAIRV